jgi:prevent-host-death family protein
MYVYDTSKGGDMREQQPMTQIMNATEARQQFASVLNRVFRKETRVVVEKSGIPVAAIVSAEDLKRLDRLDQVERERAERFAVIDEVRSAFAGVPDEEIERETDRILGINQDDASQPAASVAGKR